VPHTSMLVKILSHGTGGIGPSTLTGWPALICAFSSGVTPGCWAGVSRANLYQTTAIASPITADT